MASTEKRQEAFNSILADAERLTEEIYLKLGLQRTPDEVATIDLTYPNYRFIIMDIMEYASRDNVDLDQLIQLSVRLITLVDGFGDELAGLENAEVLKTSAQRLGDFVTGANTWKCK